MTRQNAELQTAVRELASARKTVLLVDDEDALLRVLALLLEEEGYRVLTARNGRAALETARTDVVDVVVTDFMMPEMDGGQLIHALHADRSRPPVLVMSSLEEQTVSRVCTGHAGFFRKPFDVPEFLRAVSSLAAAPREHLRLVK